MRLHPPLRWIQEAEARRVREHALLQRAVSEPRFTICALTPSPNRPGLVARLLRPSAKAAVRPQEAQFPTGDGGDNGQTQSR